MNSPAEAQVAREVLEGLVGAENVQWDCAPTMGAEDFAFMLPLGGQIALEGGKFVWDNS